MIFKAIKIIPLIILIASIRSSYAQFTFGIKFGGLAIHQKAVMPNYYRLSIDKKGRFVGYAGLSFTFSYQFNAYCGVKVIQTILPFDCAGKFSGITHVGIDLHDRIVGWENEKHSVSASIGPLFYYRQNWRTIPSYYVDNNFIGKKSSEKWEYKFVWYGGQIQYDYYYEKNRAISTNFLPGFPYIYTFNTGAEFRF